MAAIKNSPMKSRSLYAFYDGNFVDKFFIWFD